MVAAIPLRPLLKRLLPDDIFTRMAITMHGWENVFRFEPFTRWSAPQGCPKSLVFVGMARIELATWDYEIVAEILRRPKDFPQFDVANFLLNRFGDNVLSTDGEIWARHRKLVASTLNEKISKVVFDQATNLTKGLMGELFEKSGPNAKSAETKRMFDLIKKLTITVLANAGMGGNQPWKDPATKEIKDGFKLTYIESVKAVIGNLVLAAVLPRWFTSWYPSFLPGYDTMQLLSYAVGEFRNHTADLINEEKKRSALRESITRNNILSMLLSASQEERKTAAEGGNQAKANASLSDQEIMGNMFIFTAAGFDSTSNTIAYSLVELVRNPQYQDWLFEEIDAILPSDPIEPVDYATTFPKAQRCLCVMLETLRLYPPLVHIGKMTKSPQVIKTSTATIRVPAGVTFLLNSVTSHLDPEVWRDLNKPGWEATNDEDNTAALPDEYKFRPTRWVGPASPGPETVQPKIFQPPKGAFIPWSMGPRVCPGQKMAQVEFVGIILMLLRDHRMEPVKIKILEESGSEREETDSELRMRLHSLIRGSISKLTQEMDVYDVTDDEAEKGKRARGLGLRLVRRK
ncbi:hypothetical protein ABW20_dc0108254 [Dactylellina cionopaga]|nr:hypothetical protein ABW20_dc0108254 [Dactylellina cionopaga]